MAYHVVTVDGRILGERGCRQGCGAVEEGDDPLRHCRACRRCYLCAIAGRLAIHWEDVCKAEGCDLGGDGVIWGLSLQERPSALSMMQPRTGPLLKGLIYPAQ